MAAAIAVLAALLALAPGAAAATRHAAPSGGGTACTASAPCTLATAVASAGFGDVVVVAPGEYVLGESLAVGNGVTVEGAAGPRPLVRGNFGAPLVNAGAASTLRHLAIRQDASNSVALRAAAASTSLTGLFVQAAGAESTAAELGAGATMTNGVAWSSSSVGNALRVVSSGPALHNVTAWASGTHGVGIHVDPLTTSAATNTIARAPNAAAGNGGDIANFDGPAAGTITMSGSNFATTHGAVAVLGAGNQTAAPRLVAPGSGDFHQLRGSPTIDAGVPDPASLPSDFDGNARLIGAGIDIGADEYVALAPSASTGDPIAVTSGGGTLTGTVNPNGLPATYRFEYGSTPLYGKSTPARDAGAGSTPVAVSEPLSGLAPGTIVHYRLVAENADGRSVGLDRVLIVLGAPAGGGASLRFTGLTLPTTATVGQPIEIEVRGRDSSRPVNSLIVDFGDGESFFAESACRLRPPDTAFRRNRERTFTVPYTFTQPGVHRIELTLGSGRCGRTTRTTTQTVEVTVLPAQKPRAHVRASQSSEVAGAACRSADAVPVKGNRRKVQRATRCVLNHVRRLYGMKPFRKSRKLRRAAALHNRYMARGMFFAHQGPGEPSLAERLRKVGYRGGAGENLGAGAGTPYATPRGMVEGWLNSPTHRANVLERAYRWVGVAIMPRKPWEPPTPGATYTAEFGTKRR